MSFTHLRPLMRLCIVAFFVVSANICWGSSINSPKLEHQVVYVHVQEDDEAEDEGIIITDLGLVGFIVDEWSDSSLDLIPKVGDILEVVEEEDDDLWEFVHHQSGNRIYIYELGFTDLKYHSIEKYHLQEEIIQIDDGIFYRIDYDGEVGKTTRWKKGQGVWIVTNRGNDSLQFMLNIDTQEIRCVKRF